MMANSQSFTTTTTIPHQLLAHNDPDFLDELDFVNILYSGNSETSDSEKSK